MTSRILFVSFFYPPFNSIGGLRISKMSHYLLEAGWDVRVLTTDRDDVDANAPIEIPASNIVRAGLWDVNGLPKMFLGRERLRASGFELRGAGRSLAWLGHTYRDLTNIPDAQIGWYRSAVRAGNALIDQWRPDVIVSSALPATAHLIGHALSRRWGIPWVAEYRDPWVDPLSRARMWPLARLDANIERAIVPDASAIVTVSDAWAESFRSKFPRTPVAVVPNGYDLANTPKEDGPPAAPLTLAYTGRLYPRQDPSQLFDALRLLIDSGAIARDDVQVRFIGRYLGAAQDAARARSLEDVVRIDGPRSHSEALAMQQRAHALILFLGADDDVGWRPAKLYEYLGARRPILMLGGTERHEARAVMLACRAGVAAEGVTATARAIERWSAELRATGRVSYYGDEASITSFERRKLAEALSEVLRVVVAQRASGAGEQTPP